MRHTAGIYRIRQISTGRCYVGQSVNIVGRLGAHRRDLAKGVHCNPLLQNTWSKYGADDFIFEAVVLCPENMLDSLEQCLLDDPAISEFNIARCVGAPNRGVVMSDAQKAKISAANKGKTSPLRGRLVPAETGAKISAALKGRFHSPEHRARLSAAMQGRPAWNKGQARSAETRAKMSATRRAKAQCVRGHIFDTVNTHVYSNGKRACKECSRTHSREYQRLRRARVLSDRMRGE